MVKIKMLEISTTSMGIDTKEDYEKALKIYLEKITPPQNGTDFAYIIYINIFRLKAKKSKLRN